MTPKKILALTLSDGRVAIMRVYGNDEDDARRFSKFHEANFGVTIVSHREIVEGDIPAECRAGNREVRDAVIDNGMRLVIDSAKAQAIRDKRDAARAK